MLTIYIGRNEMINKTSSKDIAKVDWEATEREYARQLQDAFGDREITVEFSDVSPTLGFNSDYTDSYDVQSILDEVWDRQSFWRYKQQTTSV